MSQEKKVKKKRGRKSKKELALLKAQQANSDIPQKKIPKKRGRKPKGGKIVKNLISPIQINQETKQNIILHLKCSSVDLEKEEHFLSELAYNPNIEQVQAYNFTETNLNLLDYDSTTTSQKNPNNVYQHKNNDDNKYNSHNCDSDEKLIWTKLNELKLNLHNNNVSDKKSDCFWCTYEFDSMPIYIPKHEINNTYEVYGCFCTPECAAAFLYNENIDNSTRWERYSLLNSVYGTIFKYSKNIKPAPPPFYLLDKYYGNINIVEYRKLLENNKLLLIVDKPLTRILPELHEENNEFNINNGLAFKKTKNISYRLSRKKTENVKKPTNIFN